MKSEAQQELPKAAVQSFQYGSDPAEWPWTPAPVAVKLRQLRRERDDARVVWRSTSDELHGVRDVKRTAEGRLKELFGSQRNSQWFTPHSLPQRELPDDHPEVIAVRRRLETAEAEIKRLEPVLAARARPLEQLGHLVGSIERYCAEKLRQLGAMTLYDGPRPSRTKRDPIEAVDRCRQRIAELDDALRRVSSAPWHAAQAKHRARAEIEKLAARGQPSILPLIQTPDRAVGWRERPIYDMMIAGRSVAIEGDPAAQPLLFWLHKDAIVAKLEAAIDEAADDDRALTVDERTKQLERIARDKLAAEREEEHAVEQANLAGAHVLRRPDADPRAVLGLGDDMPSP
jgi:hypothetical protein